MCENRSEQNKARYKNIKNRTKKVIADSMRKEAEKKLTKLNEKPNNIFTLVKFTKKDGKDIEGCRQMRGKDGKLGVALYLVIVSLQSRLFNLLFHTCQDLLPCNQSMP